MAGKKDACRLRHASEFYVRAICIRALGHQERVDSLEPPLRSVTLAGLVRGVEQPTINSKDVDIITRRRLLLRLVVMLIVILGIKFIIDLILPLIVRGQKRPRPAQFFGSAGSSFFRP